MFEELNNIYNEFDIYRTIDTKFHDLNFDIKNKKIFDEFLIRYIIIIASLQLSKQQKKFQLIYIISHRLRLFIINDIKSTIFKNYITRFR